MNGPLAMTHVVIHEEARWVLTAPLTRRPVLAAGAVFLFPSENAHTTPAKMGVARCAMHVVTAVILFDWNSAV